MLKARFITTLYWRTLKLRDWVRKRTNGVELMILQRTKNRYLTKNLLYLGASDRRIGLFENVFPLENGVSYNAYLLLDEHGLAPVRGLLDASWYVGVDDALRRRRLVERHVRFGRTPAEAEAWAESTDEPNARRIAATRERADWTVMIG